MDTRRSAQLPGAVRELTNVVFLSPPTANEQSDCCENASVLDFSLRSRGQENIFSASLLGVQQGGKRPNIGKIFQVVHGLNHMIHLVIP